MDDNYDRVRAVIVPENELLAILRWRSAPRNSCIQLAADDIPEDAEVVAVGYKHSHRAFYVLLRHASFAPVLPGHEVPVVKRIGSVLLVNDGRGVRQV